MKLLEFWCEYNESFCFLYGIKALNDDIQKYRSVELTSEENDNFVKKFMPRIVHAINKLCEFAQENI